MADTLDRKEVDKVWKLVEDIRTCMLASVDGGAVRSRPMSAIARQSENAIYFLTDVSGHKDSEIEGDHHVCLSFQKDKDGKYLSISGAGRVLQDLALIKELWSVAAEAWWDGPEDASIRVIEVTPVDAQYWESTHGPAAWVQMTLAAAFGAKPDMGDTHKVRLS